MSDPDEAIYRLITGFRTSQMVALVARHGIADLLVRGPLSADQLADQTGLQSQPLRRLLRALCANGVFEEDGDGRFSLTALSELLRADVPRTRRALAVTLLEEGYGAWADLEHAVRTGETAYEHVHGRDRWAVLAEDAEASATFNAAMVDNSRRAGEELGQRYAFPDHSMIIDVGGGEGGLIAGILAAQPSLRGILADAASGLAGAPARLQAAGIAARLRLVECNFFEAVPGEGDVYLLKNVLHDWSDGECERILGHVASAMQTGSRLLVIESHAPEKADTSFDTFRVLMI